MTIVGAIAVPHPPLIVPSVGRGEEARIQKTIDAYRRAARRLLEARPDCLVVTSPHAPLFRDGFHVTTDAELEGNMARFRAYDERIHARCDVPLAQEIVRRANAAGIACVGSDHYRDDMDHGTYVPLYFVRQAAHEPAGEARGTAGGAEGAAPGAHEPAGEGWRIAESAAPGAHDGRGAAAGLPCPIVRIGLSGLPPSAHRQLGQVIAQAAGELGRRVGIIASGDLSHKLLPEGPYGFAPEGPQFDEQIGEIFASGDLEHLFDFDEAFCEAAAECGLRSFQIMAGAIDGLDCEIELLSNEGPFGVGYGVATCFPRCAPEGVATEDAACVGDGEGGEVAAAAAAVGAACGCDSADEAAAAHAATVGAAAAAGAGAAAAVGADPHVALARLAVEAFVQTGEPARLQRDLRKSLPAELLERRAGVFVSLHKWGDLRGCIGTIGPTTGCVADEILQNGVSACSRDPRFAPVRPDELDYLEYSVDVLGEAQSVASPDELDPRRYGVIVTKGHRRGLLLPNLDGVDTVADQLEIAKRKAGISPADQRVSLERFEVVRHTVGGEPRR